MSINFKEVKFKQGSKDWLNWRFNGVGASEVAALFNCDPFKYRKKLMVEKAKRLDTFKPDKFAERILDLGHTAEDVQRKVISKKIGETLEPKIYERTDYPFMRVSFDGISENFIWEHKLCGSSKYKLFENKDCPDHFYYQVQYQLLVSGRQSALLHATLLQTKPLSICYNESSIFELKADDQLQKEIFFQVKKFWKEVLDLRSSFEKKD